jgi:hypothetical protein
MDTISIYGRDNDFNVHTYEMETEIYHGMKEIWQDSLPEDYVYCPYESPVDYVEWLLCWLMD